MNTKSFVKKIFELFKPFWKNIALLVFLIFVMQGIDTLTPYLFGRGVDAVISGNFRLTFIFLAISFILSLIQTQPLSYLKEYVDVKRLDTNIQRALAKFSLKTMLGFSIGQHINEHSGVKLTVVNKGTNSLMNLVENFVYNIFQIVVQIIVVLVIMFFFDWRVAGVATSFILMYLLVSNRRNKTFFPQIDLVRKKNQAQGKLTNELYRNSTLVIAEAQEEKTVSEYDKAYGEVSSFTITTWMNYLKRYYLDKIIVLTGRYATLGLGTYYILTGDHSTGMFVTFFAWTGTIFGNLTNLMNSQRQILFQVVEIKKYFELVEIAPDIDPNIGGKTVPNLEGKIEFKDVSFAYPYRKSAKEEEEELDIDKEQEHTIENVSLAIPAGAKVGFVGVSGSGKSTIVNLMRRYYEATKGDILIDGVSIKELDLHWLRSQIGNVEQKIDLFDRSIRDNILFGLPATTAVDEAKLSQAVKDASLDEFIDKLKDHGLDTMIGESGIKVSGGERQRIGIARALIKDPKILIFDEATSALDSINEKLIHDAINRSAAGRTTIIIAHRLSTVMDADIIFVVAEGKIVGQGTHAELEKKNKEYQKLIKNQILVG